jgi:hypothetical protein
VTVGVTNREPAVPELPTAPLPPAGLTADRDQAGSTVIDLRRPQPEGRTRVRIARHENPYEHLPPEERVKVIIRVLCGLVAYEGDETVIDARTPAERGTPASAAPTHV